jgi:hypothetical protein
MEEGDTPRRKRRANGSVVFSSSPWAPPLYSGEGVHLAPPKPPRLAAKRRPRVAARVW